MVPGDRVTVLCVDGETRRAEIRQHPDTFFSQPAAVKVKGKTVSGYVTPNDNHPHNHTYPYLFIAYSYGKNGDLLPGHRFTFDNIRGSEATAA